MSNYVGVIFENERNARDGLKALWKMDDRGELTVHGAAIIRRGDTGYIDVSHKHTHAGMRTAIGFGLGALIGALAGPIGSAVGIAGAATLATGAAAGVGAATGGLVGLTGDVVKATERGNIAEDTFLTLRPNQYAVLAEVSETDKYRLDDTMEAFSGAVNRRSSQDVLFDDYGPGYYSGGLRYPYYNQYLYPYYFDSY